MIEARVRWQGGMRFTGGVDHGRGVLMALKPEVGIKPMQLFLIGLGGCIGMTVASILRKMGMGFDRYEIALRGEQLEKPPRIFTKIEIEHKFWGDGITKGKIEQGIKLARKYCPITNMVEQAVKIEHKYEIYPNMKVIE